jgi:hypothetical protein
MQIKGVTRSQVESCASMHQMRAIDAYARPGWVGVCLRPVGEYYRRTSVRGRRVNAVCWHGHARFLRELFARHPYAKVRTSNMNAQPRHVIIILEGPSDRTGWYSLDEWLNVSAESYSVGMFYGNVSPLDLCSHG